jgi:PhnB protein
MESIMKGITTYLIFNGNCGEAMKFYAKCLDAKLDLMRFSDAPMDSPKEAKDRIMHAHLQRGSSAIMASDTMPGMPHQDGNNFSIAIGCETVSEIDKLFSALSEKGKVTMPLQETFWAPRFGMLTDQFGINWMLNLEQHQK